MDTMRLKASPTADQGFELEGEGGEGGIAHTGSDDHDCCENEFE